MKELKYLKRNRFNRYVMNPVSLTSSLVVIGVLATVIYANHTTQVEAAAQTKATEAATLQAAMTRTKQPKKSVTQQPIMTDPITTPTITAPEIITASPRGMDLFVNPALSEQGRPSQISSQPTATWFGAWSGDVNGAANNLVSAATAQNALAVIVAYNIPVRDCGSYSAGGANSSDGYKTWIRQLAAGIGNRQAIVILEPDALAQITCLNSTDQATRYANLADAVNVLTTQTQAFVYLDAGHSAWMDPTEMAQRLKQANIAQAHGFALNVSNFQTSASNISYGDKLTALVDKPYVIDTSRNGNGSNGEWCNPRGRALGERPTTSADGNVDAYLWIKLPGESDGTCNGGPSAGIWWQEYAQELVTNAGY